MVEWQPYPNLPVYVVHPIHRDGYGHTLHRNNLLPISNNLEQGEGANSVGVDGPNDKLAPVPHRCDALLVECPAEQGKPFIPEKTMWTGTDPTDKGLQDDSNVLILFRQSSRSTKEVLKFYTGAK